jgi:hypothetical protein
MLSEPLLVVASLVRRNWTHPAAASGAAVPMAVQNGREKSRRAWAVSQPPGRPGAHEQQSGIEAIQASARQLLPLSSLPISDLSRFHARPAEHRILSPARLPSSWYWKQVAAMLKVSGFKPVTTLVSCSDIAVALG